MLGRRRHLIVLAAGLAAAWRLCLSVQYRGWEESDYGNLAMVRGVLEGGFLHYDMNHLPLYYGASALVMGVVGDAVVAARAVSLVCGVLTVVLGVLLADRLGGRAVAWVFAAVLVFQPELALYSASSLREPLYAALVLASLYALFGERLVLAGLWAGLAFLTRMDALLTLGPVLAVHALGRGPRGRRLGEALAPFLGMVVLWSLYCWWEHGTWAFWGHSVAVNVATGGATELASGGSWWANGLGIVGRLATEVLSSRMGWALWVGLWWGLLRTPWMRHGPRRTLSLAALTFLGFWLGIGLVAQHAPEHNLYWKWLHSVIPVVGLVGILAVASVLDQARFLLGRAGVWVVGLAAIAQGAVAFGQETGRQVQVSEALYGAQLDLARWIEAEVPEEAVLLVDNIPGAWINRRAHGRSLWTWFDVLEGREAWPREAFGAWLHVEEIAYVLWFREEWTQAPRVAPWLGGEGEVLLGSVVLVPLEREDGYGWVFYRVDPSVTD